MFKVNDKVLAKNTKNTLLTFTIADGAEYTITKTGVVNRTKVYFLDNLPTPVTSDYLVAKPAPKNLFNKSMLKDGDIVTRRDGNVRVIFQGDLIARDLHVPLRQYNDNLQYITKKTNIASNESAFDIISVRRGDKQIAEIKSVTSLVVKA